MQTNPIQAQSPLAQNHAILFPYPSEPRYCTTNPQDNKTNDEEQYSPSVTNATHTMSVVDRYI